MEQLRKHIGLSVRLENIKNAEGLKCFGFACRYLPDPPEDFDEFEFETNFEGTNDLALMVTVESMKIKRIFFGLVDPADPDVITGLSENQLERVFDQFGGKLAGFFDFITA